MTDNIPNLALLQNDHCKIGRTTLCEMIGTSPFVASGCTLLLCMEGMSVITTNAHKRTFRKGDLLLLFSDTLFAPLRISASFTVEYISLSLDIIEDIFYKMTSTAFWNGVYNHPVCRLSAEQYVLVEGVFRQMKWATENGDEICRKNILQNSVYNLFLALDAVFQSAFPSLAQENGKDQAWVLFGKFMSLLTQHFHEKREVKYYAERLCITTDYLYKITRKVEQRTPKEIIDTFTVTEIKRYLDNTSLSVKDLARLFHFDDAPYICRFFRRMTGCSISEYRTGHNHS